MQLNLHSVLLALFGLLALVVAVAQPQKSVLVSYPSDTPGYVVEAAKDAIRKAGGVITHEYKFIKGFAATASAKVFDVVNTLNMAYPATIEDDQIVFVYGDQS